jgi:primosomal protein N' (replication factor Y) (superfamily II helicase)
MASVTNTVDVPVLSPPSGPAQAVAVAVELPQHAGLSDCLHYDVSAHALPEPGQLVRVPLGKRTVPGVVWSLDPPPAPGLPLKPVADVLWALPPLNPAWRQLTAFAAGYYQRGLGELALQALPPELRKADAKQLAQRVRRLQQSVAKSRSTGSAPADTPPAPSAQPLVMPVLSAEQQAAVERVLPDIGTGRAATHLLFGATGSGKTEVYLRLAEAALAQGRQVLVMVPEINLTPQLERRFAERFPRHRLVSLHSSLTAAQRANHWLMAHLGLADLVLGTRLSVFTPLPRLGLVIVDEEHDPSYKQQDGARYSARDLAVYRGSLEGLPVLLGSATPSLESWQRAADGRYRRLDMPQRIGAGRMPALRLLDMRSAAGNTAAGKAALAPALLAALEERRARGEQSLLLLNRRGYAPVLHCSACDWKSQCSHCSAWRVFHKVDRTLRCHHCGWTDRVPKACPNCGNLDIAPLGRGTEKLAEQLSTLLPLARIARIDADSTRGVGSLESQLAAVHAGEVDVLVGTQMVTKGHDFRRMTLVAAVNPDGALFASDFRAAERLFALLMQAAGRAGRDAELAERSELWLQTWHPQHPVYAALARHDFPAFAQTQLHERSLAGLPPFSHLALLRADARDAQAATDFLLQAGEHLRELAAKASTVLADVERVQMMRAAAPAVAGAAVVASRRLSAGRRRRPAATRCWRCGSAASSQRWAGRRPGSSPSAGSSSAAP